MKKGGPSVLTMSAPAAAETFVLTTVVVDPLDVVATEE
jgi:hypothetical protein